MAERQGFTVWFTGLNGSGKRTIAQRVADELQRRGLKVELLAGSEFRKNISLGLGFTREDRIANVRRIGYVAKLLSRNGVAVITTAVSPYREVRDECRREIGHFVEVFVDCPLEVCESRDHEGIYERARLGIIDDFTGISDPYEPPLHPEVVLRSATESPEALAGQVIAYLERHQTIPAERGRGHDPDEEIVKAQLRALHDR